MSDESEYEITMRLRVQSSLDKEKLKQLLVVALLDDLTMIPDGATDELRVIEYYEIIVEVAE